MSTHTGHGGMPRSAVGLGQLLVVVVALALITVGIVTANGTVWPPLVAAVGIALLVRLVQVATTRPQQKENRHG